MTDRRTFIKGAVVAVAMTKLAGATSAIAAQNQSWKGLVYTAADEGMWKGKAYGHLPEITVAEGKVTVKTGHGMSEAHFIVRHTLLGADGTVLGGAVFTPADKPVSTYDLPKGYKGKLMATSFCNLHDLWLAEITV